MNKAAQQLVRKARGVRKKFSREELQRRTERLKLARAARWGKGSSAHEPAALVFPAPPRVNFETRFNAGGYCREERWKGQVGLDLNTLLEAVGSLDEIGEKLLRAATLRIVARVAEFESIPRQIDDGC